MTPHHSSSENALVGKDYKADSDLMKQMKASDYIAEYLKGVGVTSVYGYTGGAVTHIIDSCCNKGMTLHHYNHEQGASFAASGVAKVTRQIQVLLVTSGPGATNLITGIGEAYFDSVPLLVISGQVNTYDFKWDKKCRQMGFQETDIAKIVQPITKYAALVTDANDIPRELEKAVRIALDGRPGPVVLDIPMNFQRADIEVPNLPQHQHTPHDFSGTDFAQITAELKNAKRPLILIGNGCKIADAKQQLITLADKLQIPVVVSLLGKGCFPEDHKEFVGFIGTYGLRYANIALARSDTILVLGSRLDSRQTGNNLDIFKNKKIIQVDADADEMGVKLNIFKPIHADVRLFLEAYNKSLQHTASAHDEWRRAIHQLKDRFSLRSEQLRAHSNPFQYEFMEEINKHLRKDDIVCVDIGQTQMVAAQAITMTHDQKFVTSGGMAPMGYALPASIGIALETGRRVISLNGDGGMQINIQELNMLAKKKAPVLAIVFDNKALAMIKQFQDLYFEQRYYGTDEEHDYYSCDFKAVSEAYGVPATYISSNDANWKEQLAAAFAHPLPYVVHLDLKYQTKVYPKLRFDRDIDEPEPSVSDEEQEFINRLIPKNY